MGANLKGELVFKWTPLDHVPREEIEKYKELNKKLRLPEFAEWGKDNLGVSNAIFMINQVIFLDKSYYSNTEKDQLLVGMWNIPYAYLVNPKTSETTDIVRTYAEGEGASAHTLVPLGEDRTLLIQNNYLVKPDQPVTRYVVIDRRGKMLDLLFPRPLDTNFHSSIFGSVSLMGNDKYLITDIAEGGRLRVINSKGEVLLTWFNPRIDPSTGLPMPIRKAIYLPKNLL